MEKKELGIGLVGYKFMGQVHSNAYRRVARYYGVDPVPAMRAICGRNGPAVSKAAATLGWQDHETDYRRLVERDDVDLVDVSTPGDSHRDVVLAALEAGKHVFCEKPLANTLDEAREMLEAARNAESGTVAAVNFNYRKAPAGAHPGLRAHLHTRREGLARRDRGGKAQLPDLRGRVPRPGRARRRGAERGGRRLGRARVGGRSDG